MIHWAWLIISFFVGVAFGMFAVAFAEVAEQDENRKPKWWEDDKKMKGE